MATDPLASADPWRDYRGTTGGAGLGGAGGQVHPGDASTRLTTPSQSSPSMPAPPGLPCSSGAYASASMPLPGSYGAFATGTTMPAASPSSGVGNVGNTPPLLAGAPFMSPMQFHAQNAQAAGTPFSQFCGQPSLGMNSPPGCLGTNPIGMTPQFQGIGFPGLGLLNASTISQQLDARAAPSPPPQVQSAFEMLGKNPMTSTPSAPASPAETQETILRALTAAITGDRKSMPSWNGSVENLRSWLRQLSFWELDNNLPKNKWGMKLLQALPENSAPRKIAETIDLGLVSSEFGYSAILSAIMNKYAPYLEAAGPAAIENYFYSGERGRNESMATYVAAKEVALQDMEAQLGEKLPPRIAGRILLRHSNLSDVQREALAVKYNALLTFDQAAAALRPLDRPDALMQKVNKNFVTAAASSMADPEEECNGDEAAAEEEPESEELGPESDGEGNFTFMIYEPKEEYTEDEVNYIWAYNSAYKDVRRELQARRKGRQFFKKSNNPQGVMKKGKSKSKRPSGKGHGGSGQGRGFRKENSRGSPEELLSKTRCFACDEMGHISRDSPNRDRERANAFFLCRGPSQQRIYHTTSSSSRPTTGNYVNVSPSVQRQVEVFAGVRTEGHEAVVDTAAEEAVIGSKAMRRLTDALASLGLVPREAQGTTVSCAGIGGKAKIHGIYDIPIGVAKCNSLLRTTVIEDEEGFETPFLLPISYIELVGGIVDTFKNMFILQSGRKTPMRRTPSGHRTISVLEFNGKWNLPEPLWHELGITSDELFHLETDKKSRRLQQRPGVAVWLKKDADLVYMGTLSGPRQLFVHPSEVFEKNYLDTLSRSRTTCAVFADGSPCTFHDSWHFNQQRQLPFWSGEVYFELFGADSTSLQASSASLGLTSQVGEPTVPSFCRKETSHEQESVVHQENQLQKEPQISCERHSAAVLCPQALRSQDRHAGPHQPMAGQCGRSVQRATQEVGNQESAGVLEAIHTDVVPPLGANHQAGSHGPPVDEKQGEEGQFPGNRGEERAKEEDRRWEGSPRDRRAIAPVKGLQTMAERATIVPACGRSNAPERSKGSLSVDVLGLWKPMESPGMDCRCGGEQRGSLIQRTPGKSRGGPDYVDHRVPHQAATSKVSTGPAIAEHCGGFQRGQDQGGGKPRQGPETINASRSSPSTRSSTPKDTSYEHQREGDLGGQFGRRGTDPISAVGGLPDAPPLNHHGKENVRQSATLRSTTKARTSSGRNFKSSAKAALLSVVTILCMVPSTTANLNWLSSRMESESVEGNEFSFSLNASSTELGRTDFDGQPKLLDRHERQFVSYHLKNYLDHVGEVYSPPRVTEAAAKHGLRGRLALDLTTGWDFNEPEHRKKARQLIDERKPAVLLLSPPCRTYSPLRRLSNFKRNHEDLRQEELEGDRHMDFAIDLAEEQHAAGRGFVLEQPEKATSWKRPKMRRLLEKRGIILIQLDMCRFELRATRGPFRGKLARKPTLLATNIEEMGEHVEKQCLKNHTHGPLLGGSARDAAIYTPKFVDALIRGIKQALGFKNKSNYLITAPDGASQGRALGAIAYDYGKEQIELDEELKMAYPAALTDREEIDGEGEQLLEAVQDPGELDVVEETRRQMRDIGDQPGVLRAMDNVEDFAKMGAGAFSLAPNLRREVHRVHRQLGHPGQEVFLRALWHAGVREDILNWARQHFQCPTCAARPRPTPSRPGHLMRALEFNMVVGIDLCFLDVLNEQNIILNMLCWGTNFQQAHLCKDKSAETVLEVFMNEWVKHYGPPILLIMDRGKEFYNNKFQEVVGGLGVGLHYTDPQSPWQNGRTEKAGGVLKEKIQATIAETGAVQSELPLVIAEVVSSRNRFMDRFGFSPMQRVFGKNLRLPAALLSTDALDRELVEASAPDPIKRAWDIREAAAKEWLRRQDTAAVRRSLKAQTRNADLKQVPPGSWIYVYRDSPSYKGWVGPGVLIAEDTGGRSCWVSMRGRLWKVSREQIRPATPEEELGAELIAELSREMLDKVQRPGQIVYQDVTSETFPQNDDFADEELTRVLRIAEDRPRALGDDDYSPEQLPAQDQDMPDAGASTQDPMESLDGTSMESTPVVSQAQSRRVSIAEQPEVIMAPIPEESETIESRAVESQPEGLPADGETSFGPTSSTTSRSSSRSVPYPSVPFTPPPGYLGPAAFPFDRSVPPLPPPPPPGNSFYVEVVDFDKDEDLKHLGAKEPFIGATWRYDREQCRMTLQPRIHSRGSFTSANAEASFCFRDKCMYVTKSKASFGQVEFSKLSEKEKVAFRKARKKELDSLIANGAVRILSLEESQAFEEAFPEQVINSRFVDRFKPKEITQESIENYKRMAIQQGHLEVCKLETDQTNPKSRLCVIGWQDPQIMEVERSAPTPLSTSLYCCLQLAASRRWSTRVKDVKTAFLQALPTTRRKKLAIRQPRDEPLEGLHPKQLLLLLTEVYGLVSGPSWWRRSLLKISTEKLGYQVNVYDKCILTLPSEDPREGAPTQGFMVIEVDDIAEAGNAKHLAKMKELEEMLKFGKIDNLQCESGSSYAGRHLKQLPDYSFESHMEEFTYTRLEPIKFARKVLKKDAKDIPLNETEKSQLRGLIASLNWIAREGRPDASAAASILASSFPSPCMCHIFAANDVVRHLKTFPVKLKIHAIPEKDLRNILIADSAFDTSGKEKSQHGWLLGFTDPSMNAGKMAPVSLMQWRSKRLRRKASSSLLCEAISMSAATGALERQDAFMESIRLSHFKPRARQKSEDEHLAAMGKNMVIANESQAFRDPRSLAVMDAKALFDNLTTDQSQGEDERSALEVAIIKESLLVTAGRSRWIPHNRNPADALTKMDGAHTEPMLSLLKSNVFQIEEEEEVLNRGKQSESRLKTPMPGRNHNFWGLMNKHLDS